MRKTPFQEAWDATNKRYIEGTLAAIRETYRRRHESKHVLRSFPGNRLASQRGETVEVPEELT